VNPLSKWGVARVAELADALDSGSSPSNGVQVQVLPRAPSLSTSYAKSSTTDTKRTQYLCLKRPPKAGRKGRMPTFPQKLSKGKRTVTIYAPTKAKPVYRVDYRAHDKRKARSFQNYDEALKEAQLILEQLADDNELGAGFTSIESQQFDRLRLAAKKRGISVQKAIQDWIAAVDLLSDPGLLTEAARRYSEKVISIKGIFVEDAVKVFLDSKQSVLREQTFKQERLRLSRFASSFRCSVDQIGRAELREWINTLSKTGSKMLVGPKTRNHYRTSLGTFFKWCVDNDYLSADNLLLPILKPERAISTGGVEIYSPEEFQHLLDKSTDAIKTCIAISGLTGIRTAELLRLEWSDISATHIEVGKHKAKTRSRRLIDIHETLSHFLPVKLPKSGKIWPSSETDFGDQMRDVFKAAGVKKRKNAFRHSFISYRLSLTDDENLTSRESGNSPSMIYKNYRELVTKREAEKWFKVK